MHGEIPKKYAKLEHSGKNFMIYYFPINDFESELPKFGVFLESLDKEDGRVMAIIPNMGIVGASLLAGPSFQGIKGFAVIMKKTE